MNGVIVYEPILACASTVGLALFCYYGSSAIALVNAGVLSISNHNALCGAVAVLGRQITVCSHGVLHAYFINFQLT